MKKQLIIGAVVMGLSVGALAFGGHHGWKGGHHGGGHFAKMMSHHLELSDEQEAQIEALTAQQRKDRHKHKKAMMKDFMQLNPEDADYSAQLEALAEEKSAMMKTQIIKHGELRAEIHQILTPEQRVKAKAMMEKMMEKHERKYRDDDDE